MAEFDDERPDFDAVFRDRPDEDPPASRRRSRRPADDQDDTQNTGEVPRPRADDRPPPVPEPEFEEWEEPEPTRTSRTPRRSGARSTARSRAAIGGRAARSRSGGGGGARGGGRGASGGAAVLQHPRARLVLLAAFAVVLVVVIALVVKDCQRSQLEDAYTQYINGVAQVVTKSAQQGSDLRKIMANQAGDKPPRLKAKIAALAKEAQALEDQANGLNPPGSLDTPQRSLVNGVLAYRVTGLSKLAENLPTLLQSSDPQTKASGIAQYMKRFLASDVIYEDSFFGPAQKALQKDNITGVKVPTPQPFLPNAVLASPEGAKTLLPALQRTSSSSGGTSSDSGQLRGLSLESTVAQPSGVRLMTGTTVTVQSTELLKWAVTVKNGGNFDESNVVVKASFFYPATPNDVETREVSIPSIASGASKTVEIDGPSASKITFGDQANLTIDVVPVPGETRIDNNKAEYPVKITI